MPTTHPAAPSQPTRFEMPRRLSASALDRYRGCPRRFKFQDLIHAPMPEAAGESLVLGNAIHAALERFYGLPISERCVQNLHQALRSVWRRHARPGSFDTIEQERECGLRALSSLDRYAGTADLDVVPLAREKWVSMRLPGGPAIFGKVDRLDLARDETTIEVIDYKTSARHHLDAQELAADTAARVYVAAVEAETGREVSRVRYAYVAQGIEVAWEVEREDADHARKWIQDTVATIRADPSFEPSPGQHCGWCPFNLACDAAGRVDLKMLVSDIPDDISF